VLQTSPTSGIYTGFRSEFVQIALLTSDVIRGFVYNFIDVTNRKNEWRVVTVLIASVFVMSLNMLGNPAIYGQLSANSAGSAVIVPLAAPIADKSFVHDTESFAVQWSAFNQGTADSGDFTDSLVITYFPEGSADCSPDSAGKVVYDSQTDATDPNEFTEPSIAPNTQGQLMQTTVGPFPVGWLRLSVTLGVGQYDVPISSCMNVIKADTSSESAALQSDESMSTPSIEEEQTGLSSETNLESGNSFDSMPADSEFSEGSDSFESPAP